MSKSVGSIMAIEALMMISMDPGSTCTCIFKSQKSCMQSSRLMKGLGELFRKLKRVKRSTHI